MHPWKGGLFIIALALDSMSLLACSAADSTASSAAVVVVASGAGSATMMA